jgi:predicted DNA-binding transcriptional regulator YafY
MNHEVVPAAVLAKRFGVSVRTIQRDIATIELAGIPIMALQGSQGGYGIMKTYRMDRQLVRANELCHIITALQSVCGTLADSHMEMTLEKVKTLLPPRDLALLDEQHKRLSIDFSLLGGFAHNQDVMQVVREAVESQRLLSFSYTNNNLKQTDRVVEPLTLAFRWRSWYLFAWCRLRDDYRLFRLSRIRTPRLIPQFFERRSLSLAEFEEKQRKLNNIPMVKLLLRFDPAMRPMVEEYYDPSVCRELDDGSLVVTVTLPEDGWMYGFILSYGTYVTVLEPEHVRQKVAAMAEQVAGKYNDAASHVAFD